MMKINPLHDSAQPAGACKLQLEGEMTIYRAQAIQQDLQTYLDSYEAFDLDLQRIEEIDSSGIQLLLLLKHKSERAGRSFRISACSTAVEEVLRLFWLQDWLQQPA